MNFWKAFLAFLHAYKLGFFLSENTHTDKDGTKWGFFRLNERFTKSFAMYDIDFNITKNRHGYFHARGDDVRKDF